MRLELQVRKMDLVDLTAPAGREEELLSGRLLGAGVVTGRLHQGLPLLTDAEGLLSLHAREGRIHQELPPFDAEAVVGLFFFRTLDSLIHRVPVLNRVILGRDENLVGAYFAMTGTWKKPKLVSILHPPSRPPANAGGEEAGPGS